MVCGHRRVVAGCDGPGRLFADAPTAATPSGDALGHERVAPDQRRPQERRPGGNRQPGAAGGRRLYCRTWGAVSSRSARASTSCGIHSTYAPTLPSGGRKERRSSARRMGWTIRDSRPEGAQTQTVGILIEEQVGEVRLEKNTIEAKTPIDDRPTDHFLP